VVRFFVLRQLARSAKVEGAAMKRLALIALALALASPMALPAKAAPAEEPNWLINCRKTQIEYNGQEESIRNLTLKDIREIEKLIPYLKKCDAFWECVVRRGIKWPDGSAWVYPPLGSKWPDGQTWDGTNWPDGQTSVRAPRNRPKHCFPPRGPDGTRLGT
jgi:hypothetical protein